MAKINQEGVTISMFVKKFKRKCDVRGCKNIANVYLISKRREMGNTIAVCRDCMQEALALTENYTEPEKVIKEERPLFPHPELNLTGSSVVKNEPESKPQEVVETIAEKETIPAMDDTDAITEEPITTTTKPKTITNNKKKTDKKK